MKLSPGALCVVLVALVILFIGVVQAIPRGPACVLDNGRTDSTISSPIDAESARPDAEFNHGRSGK
ncbi:MAG: hypothetical protein ACPL7O_10185 [Armatimonadota bacterium]